MINMIIDNKKLNELKNDPEFLKLVENVKMKKVLPTQFIIVLTIEDELKALQKENLSSKQLNKKAAAILNSKLLQKIDQSSYNINRIKLVNSWVNSDHSVCFVYQNK